MRTYWLGFAAPAFLIMTGCSTSTPKEAEPVVTVQVTPVTRGSIQRVVIADAVLFPKTQSSIMPKISAPVRAFHVNRGDHVRQGQLVAELENKDLAAATTDTKGAM